MFLYRLTAENWLGLSVLEHRKQLLVTSALPLLERVSLFLLTLGIGAMILQFSYIGLSHLPKVFLAVWASPVTLLEVRFWLVIFLCVATLPGLYFIYLAAAWLLNIQILEADGDLRLRQYPLPVKSQCFRVEDIRGFAFKKPGLLARSRPHTFWLYHRTKRVRLYITVYDLDDAERLHTALNTWLFT